MSVEPYKFVREHVKTGDLILVEGKGLIGILIRVLTGQQFSHVAMFVWADGGLWVAEMREGIGFRITPASQWMTQQKSQSFWGQAPQEIVSCGDALVDHVINTRAEAPSYSYWSLFTVLLSQITHRALPAGMVCSTFIQHVWGECGIEFSKTADPGDFAWLCQQLVPIKQGES